MVAKLTGFVVGALGALAIVAIVFGWPQKQVGLRALDKISDRDLVGRLVVEECFGYLRNGTKPFVLIGAPIDPSEMLGHKDRSYETIEGAFRSYDVRFEGKWGRADDGTRFCTVSSLFDGAQPKALIVGEMASFIPWLTNLFQEPALFPDRTEVASGPTVLGWREEGKRSDQGLRVAFVVAGNPANAVTSFVSAVGPKD